MNVDPRMEVDEVSRADNDTFYLFRNYHYCSQQVISNVLCYYYRWFIENKSTYLFFK